MHPRQNILPLSLPLRLALVLAVSVSLVAGAPAAGQGDDGLAPPDEEEGHRFGVEAKVHYRDSEAARFPIPFPFSSDQLPPGESFGFVETVEEGSHFEASAVSLWYRGAWPRGESPGLAAKVKVDLIDRHDRNPTSTDDEWDVDEAWLRWGHETEPGGFQEETSYYVKLGKFPKFERQDDRHLESYGLVSTAFNRMEDVGLEFGAEVGRIFYFKTSYTAGNPLFLRDPNALAGDNGIPILAPGAVQNPDPDLKTGIPILYDADVAVDEVDFDHPETGVAVGVRFGDDAGWWNLDVMAWGYRRDLADTVEIEGSFYGGDLDLLLGPLNLFPFDVTNDQKEEWGLNVWYYRGGLSIFGQYVDQEVGGLPRDGFEVEVAYEWEIPFTRFVFGRQLFPYVAPAIRYSELDPDFTGDPLNPAVSFRWPWERLDLGVRLGILTGLDLTLEYADQEFVRAGRSESLDELLATLRFNWDWASDRP